MKVFYILLVTSITYAQQGVDEAATIVVPEPDTQTCRSDEESAVFFIDGKNVLESYAFGFIPPLTSSCKICSTGSQFSYLAINSGVDVSISDITIEAGQQSNSIIGMFGCDKSKKLCIQAVNDELYTAQSKDVVFYTTSYCQGGYCDAIILLAANSSIKRKSDGEVYSYEDQTVLVNENRKYKDASEHNYLRVRGFSCNSCAAPIPYCDKIDGRVETDSTATSGTETSETQTGTIQSDMAGIPVDFPKPSSLNDIEESGYSGFTITEVAPSVISQPQADPSTIDNYGMASRV